MYRKRYNKSSRRNSLSFITLYCEYHFKPPIVSSHAVLIRFLCIEICLESLSPRSDSAFLGYQIYRGKMYTTDGVYRTIILQHLTEFVQIIQLNDLTEFIVNLRIKKMNLIFISLGMPSKKKRVNFGTLSQSFLTPPPP